MLVQYVALRAWCLSLELFLCVSRHKLGVDVFADTDNDIPYPTNIYSFSMLVER